MADETAPSALTAADLALLRAARVWGGAAGPGFWDRFRPERRVSLRAAWESGRVGDAGSSLDRLVREHAAQARPDLARVHVSWWVRALKDEPPSVRRAVAANLPAGVAEALRDELGLTPDDLRPDRPAEPTALRAALALWGERLVGDLPERDDDPPAIAALTRFDARGVARLIRTAGLAKWAMTPGRPSDPEPGEAERFDRLRPLVAGADPRFVPVAVRDVGALAPGEPHPEVRAGLTTFARLLIPAEPHRVRWALQHVPYATAKALRVRMGAGGRNSPALARWESDVLRAAWRVLYAEGRIADDWRWGEGR